MTGARESLSPKHVRTKYKRDFTWHLGPNKMWVHAWPESVSVPECSWALFIVSIHGPTEFSSTWNMVDLENPPQRLQKHWPGCSNPDSHLEKLT